MNEEKFTGKAEIYSKYRPTYPESFINYLYSNVGLSKDSIIADIGAGTGILTNLLLSKGSYVFGVEPNEDMQKTAVNNLKSYSNFKLIKASAEKTTLNRNSIDFITVAQAFHWFDREQFRIECKRILKSTGKVILVWNRRDESSNLVNENDEINRKYCPNFKGASGGTKGGNNEQYADFFKDGIYEYKTFQNNRMIDEESFIGGNLSGSYAITKQSENYNDYILELKSLYKRYSESGYLCMPNITQSYAGEI